MKNKIFSSAERSTKTLLPDIRVDFDSITLGIFLLLRNQLDNYKLGTLSVAFDSWPKIKKCHPDESLLLEH